MLRRLLLLAVVVIVGPAIAQPTRDPSLDALPPARLERLVRLLVAPSPEELKAINGLHEGYVDRLRAEIGPDASRISAELARLEPGDDRFAPLLRERDAVEARIAAADEAFFRAAAGVVAEAQRAGLARVAAVRERQRIVRGPREDVAVLIGNGTEFVDLIDLLARESERIDPGRSAELLAFIASEDARLLDEARALAAATRDGVARWLPALRAFERSADAGDAGSAERRARQSAGDAADAGRTLRSVLRAHHAANREAVARLAPVLGEGRHAALRERAVLRALGESAFIYLGSERAASIDAVLRRARLEPSLSSAAVSAIDAAEWRWRSDRASALEVFLAELDRADRASWAAAVTVDDPALQGATVQAIGDLERHDQVFIDALAAALGSKAEVYLDRVGGPDAMSEEAGVEVEPEQWIAKNASAIEEVDPVGAASARRPFGPGTCEPVSGEELQDVLDLTGTMVDAKLLAAVHDAWLDGRWNARVEPLDLAFRKSTGRSSDMEDDGRQLEPREIAAVRESGMRLASEVDAAEAALRSDLAGAQGTPVDAAAWVLLSLRGLGRIPSPDAIDFARGDAAVVPDPIRVFALSGATPEEVRAMLADDPEAWRSLAAEARRANEAFVSILERAIRLEVESGPRVIGSAAERAARSESISREHLELVDAVKDRVWSRFMQSASRAIASPERRSALARALQRETYPAFLAPEDSAESQLEQASRLADLDDELRARLDAMTAEYLAVSEEKTARMIAVARSAELRPTGDSAEYERRMLEVDRIRLERRERMQRTLAELRILLGDERAQRIPGLLRRADPDARRSAWELVVDDD